MPGARVVVVGGGISGLTAAHRLVRGGAPVTLVEQQARLGGVIETRRVAGCVLECGPDSFLSVKPEALALIRELGLEADVIGSNDHLRVTYMLKRGRLVPLPEGLMMMVPTRVGPILNTPLLSWSTKLRMGLEYFRRPRPAEPDRSVAQFIADHYGEEAVDYLAEPLLSGVYGGDPRRLSAPSVLARFVELEQRYGSLTRGVLSERRRTSGAPPAPLFRTLKGGLGQLTAALAEPLGSSTLHKRAEAVERGRVRVDGEWIEADHVVLACPAYAAGALIAGVDGELAALLGQIEYSSSLILSLGYRASDIGRRPDGFGLLIPRRERGRLVACTFAGTKFSHRAPEDIFLVRCFLGGVGDETVLSESDDALVEIARRELGRVLTLKAQPLFHSISRWPRSMAQYTVGHRERLRQIEARLASHPFLHLAGNAYYGIGIPDCIRMGAEAATKILTGARHPVEH